MIIKCPICLCFFRDGKQIPEAEAKGDVFQKVCNHCYAKWVRRFEEEE